MILIKITFYWLLIIYIFAICANNSIITRPLEYMLQIKIDQSEPYNEVMTSYE